MLKTTDSFRINPGTKALMLRSAITNRNRQQFKEKITDKEPLISETEFELLDELNITRSHLAECLDENDRLLAEIDRLQAVIDINSWA